jgi:dGTPase
VGLRLIRLSRPNRLIVTVIAMTYDWNKLLSGERRRRSGAKRIKEIEYRIEHERDYDRLLFSTPVRRLADKTQVFPLDPHDSVRTRLTHSHEVANLARGIGTSLSYRHAKELGLEAVDQYTRAVPSLLAAIGLSHDLGNPPFGHQGEEAIQSWIKKNSQAPTAQMESFNIFDGHLTEEAQRKDFLKFEGNAQALRLLTRLQIVSDDYGLNMSYAFLAALLKYPVPSDRADKTSQSRKKFNFFQSEADVVADVWDHTGLSEGKRHPLTFVMEACDDIAYCVLDLEDAAKKGLISFNDVVAWLNHVGGRDSEHPDEMVTLLCDQAAAHEKKHRTFDLSGTELGDISMQMLRVDTIGLMVNAVTKAFVAYANQILAGSFDDELLKVSTANVIWKALKDFAKKHVYSHRSVLEVELQGHRTIHALMDAFWKAIIDRENPDDINSKRLTPYSGYVYSRISENYRRAAISSKMPMRYKELQLITDMVSGMTDTLAIDLCKKLETLGAGNA